MKSRLLKKASNIKMLDSARDLAMEHLDPFVTRFRKEIISESDPGSDAYKMFTNVENNIYASFKKLIDEIEMLKSELKNGEK